MTKDTAKQLRQMIYEATSPSMPDEARAAQKIVVLAFVDGYVRAILDDDSLLITGHSGELKKI